MESNSNSKQINTILKQAKQNYRAQATEKNLFKNKIREINIKINKAVLKTTKEKLLLEKKNIIDDYSNWLYIGWRCEQNIQISLNQLYDVNNYIINH